MMEALFAHIAKFAPALKTEEREIVTASLRQLDLKKKDFLLREGQVCTTNYFVVQGCCRMYYTKEKGVEQIVQFGIDNWWITDYGSYESGKPSTFYIQAVAPTALIAWDKHKEEELFRQVPSLERYFRLILQRTAAAAQMRSKYFTDFSGEERYHHFSESFPDFVQRVPQYMLASYLGFTPEFLSKIRAGKT